MLSVLNGALFLILRRGTRSPDLTLFGPESLNKRIGLGCDGDPSTTAGVLIVRFGWSKMSINDGSLGAL